MQARKAGELTKQFGDVLIAAGFHFHREFVVMKGGILLYSHRITQKFFDRGDLDPARIPAGGMRDVGPLWRQSLIAFKGDQDIFVAHEALASQAIMRRHVVDLGILGLGLGDLAELLQQLLLLLRQGNRISDGRTEMGDFYETGTALAVLAIEGDRYLMSLGDG